MGLITNLVQMKYQKDFDQKKTAMEGFLKLMGDPNSSDAMKQWAQQGYTDIAAPALVGGDGGKGNKKQETGVRQVLGHLLGGIGNIATAGGLGRMQQAGKQSQAQQQQLQQAFNRPKPEKMFLTQKEKDDVIANQEREAAQIRMQEFEAQDAIKQAHAQAITNQVKDKQLQQLDSLDAEEAKRAEMKLPPLFSEAQRKAWRLQVQGVNVPYQEVVPPKDRTTERMVFIGPKGEQSVLFRSPETGKMVNLAGREAQPPEGYKLQTGPGGPEGDEAGAELKERTSAHDILDDPKSTPQQKAAARETLKHLDAITAGATTRVVVENLNAQDKREQLSDVDQNVQGIISGLIPPDRAGLSRQGSWLKIQSGLIKSGFNLAKAELDWKAAQRYVSTINSAQQVRMREAASTATQMADKLGSLYNQWRSNGLTSGVKVFNKAAMEAAKNLPGQAGADAQALESQIADMVADLGNIYMGGNSPTDHALSLAQKNLSGDWNQQQFESALKLIKDNIGYRVNSIKNAGVAGMSEDSPYMPQGGQGINSGGGQPATGGRGGSGGRGAPTPNAQDYLKKWGITGGGGR